jgi:hypothetical protein
MPNPAITVRANANDATARFTIRGSVPLPFASMIPSDFGSVSTLVDARHLFNCPVR